MSEIRSLPEEPAWDGSNVDLPDAIEMNALLVQVRNQIDWALEALQLAVSDYMIAKDEYERGFAASYEAATGRNPTERKALANADVASLKVSLDNAELALDFAKKRLTAREARLSAIQTQARLFVTQAKLDLG